MSADKSRLLSKKQANCEEMKGERASVIAGCVEHHLLRVVASPYCRSVSVHARVCFFLCGVFLCHGFSMDSSRCQITTLVTFACCYKVFFAFLVSEKIFFSSLDINEFVVPSAFTKNKRNGGGLF